ncbi:MAG TPA: hypothetical protein VF875_16225 [Anaeromyxobacter sp.]
MPTPLAARRLEIHAAARGDPAGFLRLDPAGVRFSLGTSLAELVVPVEVAPDARAIVRQAAVELALLVATHHTAFVPGEDVDRLILREEYASLPPVEPRLGAAGAGGPDLRAAAQLGPAIHPALTGGLVAAWIGKGGKGRSLVALWIGLLQRAFAELAESGGKEPTPLLVALALSAGSASAAEDVRSFLPQPPLDRYVRGAALAGLWLAARTGLARAWRDAARKPDDPLLPRIEAALSPCAILGGRSATLGSGATLYGCELSAGIPRADDLTARLAQGADAEAVAGELAAAVGADGDLARRAETAAALARLREALGAAVASAEAAGSATAAEPVRSLLCAPGALAQAMGDEPERKDLLARLVGLATDVPGAVDRAGQVVKAWRPKDPAAAVGLDRAAARAAYADAAAALLADAALDRLAAPARKALSFRTGREAEGGNELEWEAGRLYRLSARAGAILRRAEERAAGHLFADVKDFTRRTALLGQASMAEYLRREFYVPILVAAKEHFGGMQHLADRGGVVLNNLVGDAVSFSGRIDQMVALAKDVRAQFRAYAARLSREISSEVVARQIAAIEGQAADGLGRAREARAAQDAALAAASPGTPGHAAAAAAAARARVEEVRLEAERERALGRARGEVLEAGVFVSYGAAPLVVVIEDEVFGRNRVAIAEKINESARGTARTASARVRADAALVRERARRGAPGLEHAWLVFVDQPMQIAVPPEAEDHAVRLFRSGDAQGALRGLVVPVRDGVEKAARPGERVGEIYNAGAALSEEALEAFLAEVGREREVRRVTLDPAEIPEALRARYLYGDAPLALVACFRRDGRVAELFRRVGVAAFRGLGEVAIWELCGEGGGAGALAGAFATRWLREGR